MARSRTARHPKPAEIAPEDESQEIPEEEPEQQTDSHPATSKAEAVRQAMSAGMDDLEGIAAYIKREHGIEMPRSQLSAYASQNRARIRKAEGGEATPRRRSQASPQAAIPPTFGQDIKLVKQLIEQAGGGDQLKELANSLASLQQKYGQAGLDGMIEAFE